MHPDYPGSYGRRTVVADFSRILAGPYATMLLADMGAEGTRLWRPAPRASVR